MLLLQHWTVWNWQTATTRFKSHNGSQKICGTYLNICCTFYMSYRSKASVKCFVSQKQGMLVFKVCLSMLGIWFCCLFKITLWLHSEYFVTPNLQRWKNVLLFSDFYLCFPWLLPVLCDWLFGSCYIDSNERLRGFLRLVASMLFMLFFYFILFFLLNLFVPVLKPLLLHSKCILSPWGYNVYLSVFPQNMLYTFVPTCNHGSDWFYLIAISACCG